MIHSNNFLPSFFTTRLVAYQHKTLHFMLPLIRLLKPNDVFILVHHLDFPLTFSEGITTNVIPTQPKVIPTKTNLNLKPKTQ